MRKCSSTLSGAEQKERGAEQRERERERKIESVREIERERANNIMSVRFLCICVAALAVVEL